MNDRRKIEHGLARLTAEADAFLEAASRQQEELSRAYREMRIDLHSLTFPAGERLTPEERLQCEAFVRAHIRQQPRQAPMQIPLPHRPAVHRSRQGRSRVHQIV